MRRLLKLCLVFSLACLLSLAALGCNTHLDVHPWISDPDHANALIDQGGATLPYSSSAKYSFYDPDWIQDLIDYCAARKAPGTAPPAFTVCKSTPADEGVVCQIETCRINPTQNGALCQASGPTFFVAYSLTDQWVAFSPPDNIALLAYCNVTVQ